MTSFSCNVFNTEYRAEFTSKKQTRTPLHVPLDCHAKRVADKGDIDPQLASLWTLDERQTNALIKKLISDRFRSLYRVDYGNHRQSKDSTQFEEDSELLKYLKRLYLDSHSENILAPPGSSKRVLGYVSPIQLRSILSTYQDTHGRTGARVIMKNATLIATRKRRQE